MYEERIKQFRARAIEKALRAGLTAYVMDEETGEGIIRFRADGVKERIVMVRGKAVVETLNLTDQWLKDHEARPGRRRL